MEFKTFDGTVRDILSTAGLKESEYVRIARILANVIRRSSLFSLPMNIETFKLKVASNMTVELPEKVKDVYKVGVPYDGEKIRVLKNRKIWRGSDLKGCTCGNDGSTNEVESCASCTFHGYLLSGYYGELYGYYPPTFPGEWEHDVDNNRIKVTGIPVGNVLFVETKVTGGDGMVMADAYLYIESLVLEKYNASNPRLKESYHLDATRELTILKRSKLERPIEEWDAMLRGAAKRAKY